VQAAKQRRRAGELDSRQYVNEVHALERRLGWVDEGEYKAQVNALRQRLTEEMLDRKDHQRRMKLLWLRHYNHFNALREAWEGFCDQARRRWGLAEDDAEAFRVRIVGQDVFKEMR
jgi:hypothetical protein